MALKRCLRVCGILIATSAMLWSCDAPEVLEPVAPRTPPESARAISGEIVATPDHRIVWVISNVTLQNSTTYTVTHWSCAWGPLEMPVPIDAYLTAMAAAIDSKHWILYGDVWNELQVLFTELPDRMRIQEGRFEQIREHMTAKTYAGELEVWDFYRDENGEESTRYPKAVYPILFQTRHGGGLFNETCHDQGGGG